MQRQAMDLKRGEGVKGRRGNTWSGGVAGEPHQWRSAGSASSSKEWHPGVEHEAEAGGGLDSEPAVADEGAVVTSQKSNKN